jgi:enamine deaminase RidA (YjgF/YER057c/UK114 family)
MHRAMLSVHASDVGHSLVAGRRPGQGGGAHPYPTQGATMHLTLDNPDGVPAPYGEYFSHVARIGLDGGALLILSGQVAVDAAGEIVAPGDVVAQAAHVFELIGAILAAHGASFADVVHIRTFMTNLDDRPGYGEVRRRYFPGLPRPASTTVEVPRLFLAGAVLEVEVTAAVAAPRG